MKGQIRNIIPFSAVDGPGNRTVIFLQGCNLNCWYCHNPETIQNLKVGDYLEGVTEMDEEALVDKIEPYKPFISGVTISGGECTVQSEFLISLCQKLKSKNYHVLIDTNGQMSAQTRECLAEVVDGFMFDLKTVDAIEHKALTGVDNETINANLIRVADLGKLYEVRTVIFGTMKEPEKTVDFVCQLIVEKSPQTRYKIIQYRAHGVREAYKESLGDIDRSLVAQLYKRAKDHGVMELILI